MIKRFNFIFTALILLGSASVQATRIDFNTPSLDPDPNNGWEMTTSVQADNFLIPYLGEYNLVSGGFWTIELSDWDGALDWYIFGDSSGAFVLPFCFHFYSHSTMRNGAT